MAFGFSSDDMERAERERDGRLQALQSRDDEIKRLRQGITDYLHGDYPRTAKTDKCPHDRYGYEGCEQCIDEYFEKLIA